MYKCFFACALLLTVYLIVSTGQHLVDTMDHVSGCRCHSSVYIFHYTSREQDIAGRDLKSAGILIGNIFGLIKKNQDGLHGHFFVSHEAVCRDFLLAPSREKGIIVRVLKFAGYVHHYKNLCLLTIFGLVLKSKMATKGIAST